MPKRHSFVVIERGSFAGRLLAAGCRVVNRWLMAYSESLADRVRQVFCRRRGRTEKKMFGGLGFLLNGNMCVGVWKTSLIARVGPDAYEDALAQPYVREFDITGRPMAGWVLVEAEGMDDDAALRDWVDHSLKFVGTLPAK